MLILYSAKEVSSLNKDYKVQEFLPGALLLGTDGGDEALVMDLREDSDTPGSFFRVPFIPMSWKDAVLVGKSIEEARSKFKFSPL